MSRLIKSAVCILMCLLSVFFVSCNTTDTSGRNSSSHIQHSSSEQSTSVQPTDYDKPESYNDLTIKQDADKINSALNKIISERKYNGVTYLKIGNDFEYISASGDANTEKHIENSINTCYYTGSITKQFTSAAILKLCEENKISLSDSVTKYFPSYKTGEKITVRNLLTMTSGIKNYVKRDNEAENYITLVSDIDNKISSDTSEEENKKIITDWIFSQDLYFEPDSEFMFSDSNYYLLGEIIEKASKMKYEDYITKFILKPLGMNMSGFGTNDKTAVSYQGSKANDSMLYSGVAYSSLGLISNVSDLLRWVDGLLAMSVISEESFDIMTAPYKENYAMGFYVSGNRLSHVGKTEDYNSMLSFNDDKSEIFVSLSNYAYTEPVYIYRLFKNSLKNYLN